ncbi:MAG: DUF4956 domain-containing protein [Bacilli bacterium]|nr:DUF4956 domain-containing protein [Bacilli bacterium]
MQNIIENITNSFTSNAITMSVIVAVLIMTLILSVYEFIVYRFVSHRSFYNKSFNISVAILPFFISMIILCLQSNIVITLGTIGALAIIRFRTAVKDPVDMVYLLWSVFIGIVCGCQLYSVGAITSIFVTIVLIILDHLNFGRCPYVLIVHSNEELESDIEDILKDKKINYKIKSRNYTSKGYDYVIEFIYKEIKELNKILSKNKKISKYSIIEYDADDIV